METLGKRIGDARKSVGLTQEALAEKLNVSPQAVSKWENDASCPDIMLLSQLAKLLNMTVDELLNGKSQPLVIYQPEGQRKNIDDMMLRVIVDSAKGDRVRVNLPMPLVIVALELGIKMPQVSGGMGANLDGIDFSKIVELVKRGALGQLVDIVSADGDTVRVVVE